MLNKIKNSNIMKPIKTAYRYFRYGKMLPFAKPKYFLNNSNGHEKVCLILAGYKQFAWEIVFKRIKKYCPEDIDVCIVSSGVYSEELKQYAEKYSWSYISMKRNCVTLALNSAIKQFPKATKLFKLDEDIFITEGFFETLPVIHELSKKDYFPVFTAPLIPINGYGYRRILEKLNLVEDYTKRFEYPRISAGIHMQVESNPDVAMYFWHKDDIIPKIDEINTIIKKKGYTNDRGGYTVCPIRFSIGAIFFERILLETFGWFPVNKGTGMGIDEEFLCNLATSQSKAIIVTENQVVGHLSFGKQNKTMEEYYQNNKGFFDIETEL